MGQEFEEDLARQSLPGVSGVAGLRCQLGLQSPEGSVGPGVQHGACECELLAVGWDLMELVAKVLPAASSIQGSESYWTCYTEAHTQP